MSATNQLPAILGTLDSLGVPMWLTATRSGKQIPPRGWPTLTAADNRARLSHYSPGMAVCGAVTDRWAFVDVDTKAGASIEAAEAWLQGLGVSPWARISTPSGGAHFYVSGAPGQANYPGETVAKLTGLVGVEVFGGISPSAHFAFLPGSERPKYPGKGYTVEWEHPELIDADATPLWDALAHAAAERRTGQGSPEESANSAERAGTDTPPPSHPSEGRPRAEAYTRSVVDGEADKLARTAQGGRNNQLYQAALKIGSGTMLTLDQTIAALEPAAQACGLDADSGRTQVIATIRSGHAAGSAVRRDTPATNPDSVGVAPNLITGNSAPAGQPEGMSVMDMAPEPGQGGHDTPAPTGDEPHRRLVFTAASQITPKVTQWVWVNDGNGRMPAGALSLAAGREGTGKSSFGIWLSSQITRGLLPGMWKGTPRNVIYLAVEDSWAQTLLPRLMAAGADLDRVFRVEAVTAEGEESTITLPVDVGDLRAGISQHDVGLVVADPLMSLMSGRIDTHKEADTRRALEPLAKIADQTGAVILGIAHFNKSGGSDINSLITGSGAFKNVPRAVFGFARDEDTGESVMTQGKNSLGRLDLPSLAYRIASTTVRLKDGETDVGRFEFMGTSTTTARDLLRANHDTDEPESADCATWLREWATEEGGTLKAKEAKAAARQAGYSIDQTNRAKRKLGMDSKRSGFGKNSEVFWVLPGTDSETPEPHTWHIDGIDGSPRDAPPMPPMAPPMEERPDPDPAPSVLHSADLPGFRATRHPAAVPNTAPTPLHVTDVASGHSIPTRPRAAPTPSRQLDPDWLLFPGSTTCKDCGNDLLTETGALGRCIDHHLTKPGQAA
ncbi:AAA family ATPase [Propionibacterium freudenreichii]|uniref:AAA family ATPase n=1 Tax=Propionibacterium freudenreichii TaxID=1744 RepID=UPI0025516400|nr:AAA family ATPase [Propionibacterium freudenreichii]MDK9646989.1 AAA family ATPase [Propionibacterium freudenreichii]